MAEDKVVNPEEANLAPDQEQEEQAPEASEGVKTPEADGKDYKAIAEQLSRDIQEKNRKIQELKRQPQVEAPTEDETVKRFMDTEKRSIKAEANYEILMKMQQDPTFKERADIVKDYVEQGYNIDMADRLAKADIMDKILTALPEEDTIKQPKQIKTQATPETNDYQETGDPLKDLLNNPNVPEGMKESARRYF